MREFKLPDVGEGVAEGELLTWHVEPGDRVTEDQVVAEVETDKAVVDVPSPVDGTVRELRAEPGDIVPVGDVLLTFDVDGEAPTGASEASDSADAGAAGDGPASGHVFAPPSARRLARELDVDLATVDGSGPGGRVTEGDVRAAAEGDGTDGRDDESDDGLTSVVSAVDATAAPPEATDRDRTLATPATRRVAQELGVDLDSVPTGETRDGEAYVTEAAVREYAEAQQRAQAADAAAVAEGAKAAETAVEPADGSLPVATGEAERREPYRGVRKTIGEAMERSKYTAPHVTHHDTVDVSDLVEARARLKPRAEEEGVKLTYLPFVMKAVVAALEDHPVLNTSLDEDNEEVVYRNYYHIGVATATDVGLMVPVVEDVDDKGLLEIAAEVTDLTARARDRSISRDELRGSTFTVTNFGAIGGEYATPIINYPETAILGLGAIEQRPTVVDSETRSVSDGASDSAASAEVVARHTLPLSLSIDHRVIDGAEAATFVNTLKEYLADPTLLLLE
jgi:pyruvate dehydrogenase E2 component (dihydrolipoamide acetyltransferase)